MNPQGLYSAGLIQSGNRIASSRTLVGGGPPTIDATVAFYGEPKHSARLRNALARVADYVNDLAVKLFDLAGRIRGGAR